LNSEPDGKLGLNFTKMLGEALSDFQINSSATAAVQLSQSMRELLDIMYTSSRWSEIKKMAHEFAMSTGYPARVFRNRGGERLVILLGVKFGGGSTWPGKDVRT